MGSADEQVSGPGDERPKGPRRRLLGPWTFLILILAGAILVYIYRDEPLEDREDRRERPPVAVELAPAATVNLLDTVRGGGTLEPVQKVEIKPEASGKVKAVHFQEGGFVSENKLLFELEEQKLLRRLSAQEAALEEARAEADNLRRNYQRFSMLRQQEVISEEEYDRIRTDLDAAEARVRRLRAEVEHVREEIHDTIIRAPFDGYVSERLVDPGTFVSKGEILTVLYQVDPLKISFFLPEKYAGRTSLGQEVRITVSAYPDETFSGKVGYISPSIDESTRKFRIRANIANPEQKLRPGFFARAVLILGLREESVVVPEKSLVPIRDGYMVFTVDKENNRARTQRVSIGMRRPGLVEILDGVSRNDTVVAAGHMQLEDGSQVEIVEEWSEEWAREMENFFPPGESRTAEKGREG